MTAPSQRVTGDEIDWIIEQLQTKVKGMQERLEFEEKIRQKEIESSEHKVATSIETLDDIDRYVMQDLGYDMDALEQLVRELTPEQSAALEEIDFTGRVNITAEEMTAEINAVPGLTEVQVQTLVEMEMSLLRNEALKNITKMD
jgi:N-methylhydantoinase B/oxoprolinase/acetone carboxylase alpha subunit